MWKNFRDVWDWRNRMLGEQQAQEPPAEVIRAEPPPATTSTPDPQLEPDPGFGPDAATWTPETPQPDGEYSAGYHDGYRTGIQVEQHAVRRYLLQQLSLGVLDPSTLNTVLAHLGRYAHRKPTRPEPQPELAADEPGEWTQPELPLDWSGYAPPEKVIAAPDIPFEVNVSDRTSTSGSPIDSARPQTFTYGTGSVRIQESGSTESEQ